MKSDILDYEFECDDAVDVVKPERMQDISDSLALIKEIVNRRLFGEDAVIEVTHSEKDLRFWQIRIRCIDLSVSKNEIAMLRRAIKYANEFECAATDDERVEVVIGFHDCANRFTKVKK